MIAYLEGKIINKTNKSIILLTNKVGYEIFLPEKILLTTKINNEAQFYIYHKQKEDAQELYGFQSLSGRDFFTKLISVSGVGPKSGLNIMAMADISNLKEAIISGNAEIFQKVSGIGKKTAERIIVELKNKFSALSSTKTENTDSNNSNLEIFSALNALGFTDDDIRSVYNKVPSDLEDISAKIKFALRLLKK